MAAGEVDVTVNAAPDAVWEKIGDFGGLASFMPGIDSCVLEGDDRVLSLMGMSIRERLTGRDEAARSITYSVVDGVPIESHTATITVEPAGDGSKVTWSYDVSPDEMAPIFGDTYKGALASLEGLFG
jgi:mxaD protein